ncbi:MAG: hypothetical protein LBU65_14615 [Planctomycetaceae bacterium]|jgi:glycerophosphoryl diester phosphodiesterase|nr:hypothetical protein [Planctomycetaceae bacterium]
MKPLLFSLFVVLTGLSVSLLYAQDSSASLRSKTAHRGFSSVAPENTMVAYKLAVEAGADSVECDVYRTADGVLVLSHDGNVKRTTGRDADITKITYDEVSKLDAGSWKDKKFAGERIPTLEEYLRFLKGSTAIPFVEIKQEGIIGDVVALFKKLEMTNEVFVISFSPKVLTELKQIAPTIKFAYLLGYKVEGTADSYADTLITKITTDAEKVGTKNVSLNHDMVSQKLVKTLHDKGYKVLVWTVNDAKRMNELLDWGVDGITTDKIDLLNEVIKNRGK